MQQPMDSYVCDISTSSESIFTFSRDKHIPVEIWYTYLRQKKKSDKTRELSDLKFIPQP